MEIGDLVCWKRTSGSSSYYDIGIVLSMEANEAPYAVFRFMVEVYFMRIGHLWCAPDYLEIVSSYKD